MSLRNYSYLIKINFHIISANLKEQLSQAEISLQKGLHVERKLNYIKFNIFNSNSILS